MPSEPFIAVAAAPSSLFFFVFLFLQVLMDKGYDGKAADIWSSGGERTAPVCKHAPLAD
jgi:hypothetical protein